ncbi:hypothetical protein [Paenibacillus dendritiformis]|uniref:Uncharacterized protein n=1 Tax=Paenibacillus dendritiformis C454 TaxID=1131935 RepID=H3SLY5_9BACL|nr:hypothetical protein [Paenibacillus dendritiformis]EHQ59901.1 hypothetical protein PDENDC454_22869 [Paenibacillus dendritiformis C454]CAH8768656.1 hypothetical protein H7S4_001354 [Paenibacillus dendritiformis]
MSPHPEEFLQIYIILVPFTPNRSESGEIPAALQDSLFGEVVDIELMHFYRIFGAIRRYNALSLLVVGVPG